MPECQKECQKICQKECQKICQIERVTMGITRSKVIFIDSYQSCCEPDSCKVFRKRRASAVAAEVKSSEPSALQVPSDEHWTQKHEAEAQVQKKRRRERALETAAHNGLTTEEMHQEIGHDSAQAVAAHKAARIEKVTRYQANKLKEARQTEKAMQSISAICYGKKDYLSAAKPATGNAALDRHMTSMGAMFESSTLKAEVSVVNDIIQPPGNLLWNAFLSGSVLLSAQAFCSGNGPAVKYISTMSIPRSFFCTTGFQSDFSELAGVIVARAADRDSKWKLLSDSHQFSEALKKAQAKQRAASELLAFVTESEIGTIESAFPEQTTVDEIRCKLLTRSVTPSLLVLRSREAKWAPVTCQFSLSTCKSSQT